MCAYVYIRVFSFESTIKLLNSDDPNSDIELLSKNMLLLQKNMRLLKKVIWLKRLSDSIFYEE